MAKKPTKKLDEIGKKFGADREKALNDALEIIEEISIPVDTSKDEAMISLLEAAIGTKTISRYSDLYCKLALDAVRIVSQDAAAVSNPQVTANASKNAPQPPPTPALKPHEIDIKRYARVEKVPGGPGETAAPYRQVPRGHSERARADLLMDRRAGGRLTVHTVGGAPEDELRVRHHRRGGVHEKA